MIWEGIARARNIANRNRPTMNRDGETFVKELKKKASWWKKMAKLQKRTVGALVTVVRQREVANKVVRILNTRIEQVEKANERLIRAKWSFWHREPDFSNNLHLQHTYGPISPKTDMAHLQTVTFSSALEIFEGNRHFILHHFRGGHVKSG